MVAFLLEQRGLVQGKPAKTSGPWSAPRAGWQRKSLPFSISAWSCLFENPRMQSWAVSRATLVPPQRFVAPSAASGLSAFDSRYSRPLGANLITPATGLPGFEKLRPVLHSKAFDRKDQASAPRGVSMPRAPVRSGGRCTAYYCGDAASRSTDPCAHGPPERLQPPPACPAAAR